MTSAIPFPVDSITTFDGLPRLRNSCLELTLHAWAPGSLSLLYELVEADIPCTASVEISDDGVISLISVQASQGIDA